MLFHNHWHLYTKMKLYLMTDKGLISGCEDILRHEKPLNLLRKTRWCQKCFQGVWSADEPVAGWRSFPGIAESSLQLPKALESLHGDQSWFLPSQHGAFLSPVDCKWLPVYLSPDFNSWPTPGRLLRRLQPAWVFICRSYLLAPHCCVWNPRLSACPFTHAFRTFALMCLLDRPSLHAATQSSLPFQGCCLLQRCPGGL